MIYLIHWDRTTALNLSACCLIEHYLSALSALLWYC